MLTPLPMDEDISSLSAILLDDDYYEFLKQRKVTVNGVTVLDEAYLIPFKAKAWMDLTDRKSAGEHIDRKKIKKHKNDVFRLTELIDPTAKTESERACQDAREHTTQPKGGAGHSAGKGCLFGMAEGEKRTAITTDRAVEDAESSSTAFLCRYGGVHFTGQRQKGRIRVGGRVYAI